jgi:hypothetical protein
MGRGSISDGIRGVTGRRHAMSLENPKTNFPVSGTA